MTSPASSRVLFVDDDPEILNALRRGLRRFRSHFRFAFAVGGEAGLSELDAEPVDVIVSDLAMPGMDGISLLRQAQATHPNTLRIMMSGTADNKRTLQAVPLAQQFVAKPIEIRELMAVVQSAIERRELMSNRAIIAVVGSLGSLPSPPTLYTQLTVALTDPDVGLPEIAKLVEADVAMTARVLHVVNSAFFSTANTLACIIDAVTHLGSRTLQDLVLFEEVYARAHKQKLPSGYSLAAEQERAMQCATIASQLAFPKLARRALVAGLLHGIGRLVLASQLPDEYAAIIAQAGKSPELPSHCVESHILGVHHAQIGAYLLGTWGLPSDVVGAIAEQHDVPVANSAGGPSVALALHCAVLILDGLDDEDTLRALNMFEVVESWRANRDQ